MPIALMFLGCWLWWPLGLAILALFFIGHWMWWPLGLLVLAFIIGSGRMGCAHRRRYRRRVADALDRVCDRRPAWRRFAAWSSSSRRIPLFGMRRTPDQ